MQNLVNRFKANGIHLWTENGKIKYKASKESMKPAVLAELKANKEALIKYLSEKNDDSNVAIVIDRTNRFEPFPLTDVQSAYLLGRSKTLNTAASLATFILKSVTQNSKRKKFAIFGMQLHANTTCSTRSSTKAVISK